VDQDGQEGLRRRERPPRRGGGRRLCFGWIDGRREGLDDTYFLQRFTPRRSRSRWSRINRDKVERMTVEGRMRPAGIAEVERARADGRWDAADEGSRGS
jgi:uncharacterized protein YdeI (YjbR/CyaY-like superfamily)